MKKITNWTESLSRFHDNNTPFAYIDIVDGTKTHTVKLYWTTGGVYGSQVSAFIYKQGNDGLNTVYHDKTNGCGYCKKSHMWSSILHQFGWKNEAKGEDFINWKYHVGGNYYRYDLSTI